MSLIDNIQDEVKVAMRAKDKARLSVLRLITAAVKQREVDERITLNDDQLMIVLDKMLKQRRESIAQYEKAGRQELVDQEAFEITVIQTFLPAQLTQDEITQVVQEAVQKTGASSMKDMAAVMALVKPAIQGRADAAFVSQLVKKTLAG